ncbi:hypothetical protein AB7849_09420 [Rhodanobacter sp. 115]|uniref:hypothetical protein n=1 Tax=Rhodanobacter sp. FW021-MT20 TaxID=1162282 RepID=UPI0034E479B3
MHIFHASACGNLLDESITVCAQRAADAIRAKGKDQLVAVIVSDTGAVRLASSEAEPPPRFEKIGTYVVSGELRSRAALAKRLATDLAESNVAILYNTPLPARR